MQRSNHTWILLISFLWAEQRSYAQCENVNSAWHSLRHNSVLKPEQGVREAAKLQSQWLACSQLPDSIFIGLLLFKGEQFRLLGQLDSARKNVDRAIYYAKKSPQADYMLVQAYCLAGYLADSQGELAKKFFSNAVKKAILWPAGKVWGVQAQINMAYLSSSEGDYQQAIVHAEDGQQWALALKDDVSRARLIREKAYALYWLRRFDEAAFNTQEAIRLATVARDIAMERYYLLLGDIENKRGHLSPAIQAYHRATSLAQQSDDKFLLAIVLTNLGFLHYQQKDYNQAIHCNQQALLLQKNLFSRSRLFDNLAACYWKMGHFELALTTYQQGLIAMPIGFKGGGIVKNPSPQSVRIALRKEVLLTLIQDKADTWLDYAKATNSPQRLKYALDTYKVADQMIDFMRWEHTGNLSKLYWRGKTRGLYERAIETCYRLNDTEQAFRFFEKSRAVMLADKLNELGARQKLTQNQVDKENDLRKAVSDQQAQLAGMAPDSAIYKSARMELFAKQERLDAFLKQLEISNPDYYRYKYDTTITALADLRSRLNTQKASFVTYFVGDSALYVLGVTADGVKVLRQPVSGYQQAMKGFMSLLWNPEAMNRKLNFDQFLAYGNGLYQRLLAPLNLPAGRVIVSPDGSFVPFETLSRKVGTPDYLVNDYAFSYIYSARLLLKKNGGNFAKNSFNQLDFLGVAPVDFAPSLKQVMLPGSDTALASIARRFNSSKLLTHSYATRREFLAQAADARVIHLFTHATADSSDQEEPKLYFADSTLQLSELSDRTLPKTQLVVLAACKTGIGANQRGEGVFSLARGFAALGVPSVLTTLWSVQNDATYQLTNLFYKHLDEGLPKDIALQRAKKEWLETAGGVNRLPNYWAGLIVVGDAEPLPHLHLALWGSFLTVLLLAAGLIFWHERKKSRITRPISLPQPA